MAHPGPALFVAVCLAVVAAASPTRAELAPEEVALVVARGNRDSMGLARYYCRQRGVPESNLIEVDVPPGEVLDREKWRWAVRPEIREWLTKNDPERKLRCLVTTWGIPLKITKGKPSESAETYLAYLRAERDSRVEKLRRINEALDQLAGGSELAEAFASLPEEDRDDAGEEGAKPGALEQRLESSLRSAQQRIRELPPDQRRPQEARLQQLATATGGARVLLLGLGQQVQALQASGEDAPPPMLEQFHLLRGRSSAFTELRLLLDARAPSFDRDELTLRVLEQTSGLLGTVDWLKKAIQAANRGETTASLDSELSLVLWQDGYELLRWQPNYLRGAFNESELKEAFPTLMVSRLDGPDLKTAKRLIDDAIATEKAGGLEGTLYFDARGLAELEGPPLEPGSYADFDRSLLVTAKGFESIQNAEGEPRFEVKLNNLPELFAPGQCPDAALYCGWYSLAKYVDAFDFNRGAIAYHLASAEAVTLKEIDSQAWCKKLLEDGVAATIGPVNEPYLVAFPRPNEFFALLAQGRLTLVEAYYLTKPFNSWQMVLIGDPLYRPYGPKPAAE